MKPRKFVFNSNQNQRIFFPKNQIVERFQEESKPLQDLLLKRAQTHDNWVDERTSIFFSFVSTHFTL